MNRRNSSQRGFSLIEVLVTLVLITIGILGMVGLQGRAIQYTQDSVQRNTAVMLANDLLELIRANPAGLPASSGFYKSAGSDFADEPASCSPLPAAAADQLACWAARAADALPGADELLKDEYYICRTNKPGQCTNTGGTLEIQVAWRVRSGECLDASVTGENPDLTICRYRLLTRI